MTKIKFIAKILFIFIFILSGVFIVVSVINVNENRNHINNYLVPYNISLTKELKTELKFFPLPYIIILDNQISYKDSKDYLEINFPKVEIHFLAFSLIFGKTKFSKILFADSSSINTNMKFMQNPISYINSYLENSHNNLPLNELIFQNLKISFENNFYTRVKVANLLLKPDLLHLSISETNKNINIDIRDRKLKASYNDNILNLNIDTEIVNSNEFDAGINFNIINKGSFFNRYIYSNNNFSSLFNHIEGNINGAFNISLSNNKLNIKDFKILANNLNSSGTGSVTLQNNKMDSNIIFENINFTSSDNVISDSSDHRSYEYNSYVKFNLFKGLDNNISINIKNAKINDNVVKDASFEMISNDDNIILLPSTINYNDNNKISLFGMVTNNGYRSIFDGHIEAEGQNSKDINELFKIDSDKSNIFKFDSDVAISERELRFYNIDYSLLESNLTGKLLVKYDDTTPSYDFNLTIKDADLPVEAIGKLNEKFSKLFSDLTDSKVTKFQWLRKLDFELISDVNFINSKFSNQLYKHLGFEFNIRKGAMSLAHLKVNSEDNLFKANIAIDTRQIEPQLNIIIVGDKLDSEEFSKDFGFVSKDSSIIDKVKSIDLTNIGSSLNIDLKMLKYEDYGLNNFRLVSAIGNNQILISKLDLGIFSGYLTSQGSIQIDPNIYSLSFAFNNIKMEELFSKFDINCCSGYMSTNGSLITRGSKMTDIIANTQSDMKVIAKNLSIKNFNLDTIIDAAASGKAYDKNKFALLMSNATIGNSLFDDASADFKISNSLLKTDNVALSNQKAAGVIGINIDINNMLINLMMKIGFIPRPKDKVLNLSVHVSDSIEKPKIDIDASQIESYLKTAR